MSNEEVIGLLKHQIREMSQDIDNYLERLERYEKALKEIANFYDEHKYFPTYELTRRIADIAINE